MPFDLETLAILKGALDEAHLFQHGGTATTFEQNSQRRRRLTYGNSI
jgi:hypothetical protein